MALYIVTYTNNSGAGSLRQAVLDANATAAVDTINFDASLSGQTIILTTGELMITKSLTVDGDIDGDNRAFKDFDGRAEWLCSKLIN